MVADKLAYVKDINARKASNPLVMLKPLLAAVNDVEENKKFLETLTQITNAMDSVSMEASNIIPISDGK